MELINKDRKYIEKEHIELISKKVKLIEKELQDKMYEMAYRRRQSEMFMQMLMQDEYQDTNTRAR
jgi:predicted ATP-dependent protease